MAMVIFVMSISIMMTMIMMLFLLFSLVSACVFAEFLVELLANRLSVGSQFFMEFRSSYLAPIRLFLDLRIPRFCRCTAKRNVLGCGLSWFLGKH